MASAPLSIDEKARLTAGADMWMTHPEPRLGLRALRFSDGPSGVRGPSGDERDTAWCTPCGAALAASWDTRLAEDLGDFIAREARRRSVDVVLGPVLNIPRSPLAGRNFECLSEDPLLAGSIGAAWIAGVQRQGVGACPKHFVANDAETSRTRVDCVIDERALHEVYLRAFELALDGQPWAIMTAYNRVNGTYAAEHPDLLRGVLRERWGSDALVVSDWRGARSTVGCALGGLDLEMPGPPRVFGPVLADAARRGTVPEALLDDKLERLRRLSDRTSAARARHDGDDVAAPPSAYGRREPPRPLTRAAAAGFVLLKNDAGLLPLASGRRPRVLAVVGPNAFEPCFQGWGSSLVAMGPTVDPLAAIVDRFDTTRVVAEPGCSPRYVLRGLDRLDVRTPGAERLPGILVEYFHGADAASSPVAREVRHTSWLLWGDDLPGERPDGPTFVRASTVLTADRSGTHVFSVRGSGASRIVVDGHQVAALGALAGPADPFAAWFVDALAEGDVELAAGRPVRVDLEMVCEPGSYHMLRFGCRPPDPVDLLERAITAARKADAVVLMVGTDQDIETESRDRTTSSLPGGQDELVQRVLEANPSTVIVVNAGRAVDLPWAARASTILYSWLPGHGFGPALAAVLAGDLEPGGRLPITIAACRDDYPAYDTVPDGDCRLHYRDSHLVGYRGFDAADVAPAFCFGHGLAYTDFAYGQLATSASSLGRDETLTASVVVRNTGDRTGREIVQLYVSGPARGIPRAPRQLAAFAAVQVPANAATTVELELDRRRLADWNPRERRWLVEGGEYRLHVGRSSRDLRLSTTINAAGGPP
jgi:beta-glucosidase